MTQYQREQYQHGQDIGKIATTIHIAINAVWGVDLENGGTLMSYERIGYHSGTDFLMQGFIDSGKPIIIHRIVDDRLVSINYQ